MIYMNLENDDDDDDMMTIEHGESQTCLGRSVVKKNAFQFSINEFLEWFDSLN